MAQDSTVVGDWLTKASKDVLLFYLLLRSMVFFSDLPPDSTVVLGDYLAEAPKEVLLLKLLLKSMVFFFGYSIENWFDAAIGNWLDSAKSGMVCIGSFWQKVNET